MRTATLYNFLVEANIIAGVAILLLTLVRVLLRKQLGNRVLYFAWLLVAIRLLCPLALPNPVINEIRPGYLDDQAIRPIAGQIKVRFSDASHFLARDLRGGERTSDSLVQGLNAIANSADNGTLSYRLMLLYLYGAGAVLCFFVFFNIRFRRKLKAGRIEPISGKLLEQYQALCKQRHVKPIPVYYTDPLPSACLVGVLRPYIALPLTAVPRDAIQVLTHEVCHYKGKDHVLSVLRLLCCVLHWFNPLVWLAANLSRTDGELNCDDRVVKKLSPEEKLAYTNVLVLSAAKRDAPGVAVLATGMTMTGKKLKNRVNAILYGGHVKKGPALAFGLLACAALVAAFATAEYRERPVIPAFAQSQSATYASKNIESDVEAIAYAQAFWQSDLIDFDASDAKWTAEYINGAYEVQATSPVMAAPSRISFLPDGTIVEFNASNSWITSHPSPDLYDSNDAMHQEAGEYILAFAKALLPGVADRFDGLHWWQYIGKSENNEDHFTGFIGVNQDNAFVCQFEVQVLPEMRIAYFLMGGEMRSQISPQGDIVAASLQTGGGDIQIKGFSATDIAKEDKHFASPSSWDISLENALDIALKAIYDHYGETPQTMSRFLLEYGYSTEPNPNFESHYWQFDFRCSDPLDRYEIMIHSPDGTLLYLGGPDGSNM